MKHSLRGEWETKRVWLDGEELLADESLKVYRHSPDLYNWGYEGSGPAQLALAIMLELMPEDQAVRAYQIFKRIHIAALPKADFVYEFEM